jgi:hypothetical protein
VIVPDTIEAVRQLISSRLSELDAEAKKLERALGSLGEASGPPRRLSPRPSKSIAAPSKPKRTLAPKSKRTKRAARGQRRDQLLAAIKAEPGARPAELARSIGIRPTQAHALIAEAHAERLVLKRGNGYFLSAKADL